MKKTVWISITIAVVLAAGTIIIAQDTLPTTKPATRPATQPKFKIKLSKDTTRITWPLTKDGRPDYIAAINQQYSRGVTKENNAAVLLFEVFGPKITMDSIWKRTLKKWGVTPAENGKYLESPDSSIILKDSFDTAQKGPWEARNHSELAEWLDENKTLLDKVVEASKRKRYYAPMMTVKPDSLLFEISLPSLKYRIVANALIVRANLAIAEGRIDDAREDILAVYRLSLLLDRGPFIIGRLVSIAVEVTASEAVQKLAISGELNIAQAKKLLEDMAALKPRALVAEALDTGERYFLLDAIIRIAHSKDDNIAKDLFILGDDSDERIKKRRQLIEFSKIDWDSMLREINRLYDLKVIAMKRWPDLKARNEFEKEVDRHKEAVNKLPTNKAIDGVDPDTRWGTSWAVTFFMPSLFRAEILNHRASVNRDLAKMALALAAYKLTEGHYPKKLDALAPKYIKKLPTDFFADGKPFIYRLTDNGREYTLYSVGENLKDDGGKHDHRKGDIVVSSMDPEDEKEDF